MESHAAMDNIHGKIKVFLKVISKTDLGMEMACGKKDLEIQINIKGNI
jgi:hypothetical protein